LDEGWPFWFSKIDASEALGIRERITNFLAVPYPMEPLTLRYHISDLEGKQICVKHEILLHRIADRTLAINYLFDVSDKERIEKYFAMSERPDKSNFTLDQCFHISEREKEVLQLIANGFSSKEIADMLFISNHTAISHRKNLIEKFQVKNTAHLITRAMGLIDL
jgi:DNA-binding CsgD family transcriptional regulator